MASPTEKVAIEQPRKIAFQFCTDCSNLLHPKEDKETNTLLYHCRMCGFIQNATSSCIYRHELNNTIGETAGITQDVGSDPTLPRSNKQCPSCDQTEAVFFQSQQRTAETGMKLFFVCCNCGHVWQ